MHAQTENTRQAGKAICPVCDKPLFWQLRLDRKEKPYYYARCSMNPMHLKGFVHWDYEAMRLDMTEWLFNPQDTCCPVCGFTVKDGWGQTKRGKRFLYLSCSDNPNHLRLFCHTPDRIQSKWISDENTPGDEASHVVKEEPISDAYTGSLPESGDIELPGL